MQLKVAPSLIGQSLPITLIKRTTIRAMYKSLAEIKSQQISKNILR